MSDKTEKTHLTGVDRAGVAALFHALADEHGCDVAEVIPPDLLPAIEALVEAKVRRATAPLTAVRTLVTSTQTDLFRDEACRHAVAQPYADNRYVRLLDDVRRMVTPSGEQS